MDTRFGKFLSEGILEGLTYYQAAHIPSMETSSGLEDVDPYNPEAIVAMGQQFGEWDGDQPTVRPLAGGGWIYTTLSERDIAVYPDHDGWILDCSRWWHESRWFRQALLEHAGQVLDVPKGTVETALQDVDEERDRAIDETIYSPSHRKECRPYARTERVGSCVVFETNDTATFKAMLLSQMWAAQDG